MKQRLMTLLILMSAIIALPLSLAAKETRGVKINSKASVDLNELYSKSYAVVIGINNYEKWPSLEYAVNDAKSIERKLKALGFETVSLINQNATRDNILKVLGDELPRKVGKNDRVIIFFAGHGQTEQLADDSQMGYIVPVDADTGNIFSTAISMDQVRIFSRRLKAKHVLYLIDSCYAGLGLTRSGSIPPNEKDYLRKITTRKAHQMLVAGGKGELAHEEGNHGVFTKYLLEALDGAADRDEKGYITFSDISSYVKPKVSRQTKNEQVPQYGNIDGEGDFVFVSTAASTGTAPSPKTQGEQQNLSEEKKRLEQERSDLAAQRAQLEEERKMVQERQKLETERKALEDQRQKLAEDRKAISSYTPPAGDLRRRRAAIDTNLEGVVIRIVYIPRRKYDADKVLQKLSALGAKIVLYETSDSGNAAYMGKLIVKNGYENYSSVIIKAVQDVEYLTADNSSSYQTYFNDGQQFNLWIAK